MDTVGKLLEALKSQEIRYASATRAGYPLHAQALHAEGATDDAMLVERLGEPVMIVEGSERNLKVTTAEDLVVARAISGAGSSTSRPSHKRF